MVKKQVFRVVPGVLIFVLSLGTWWAFNNSMRDGGDWVFKIMFPSALVLALGVCLALHYLLEKERGFALLAPIPVLLPFFFFVQWRPSLIFWVVLAALFLLLAAYRANREKALRLRMVPVAIMHLGLASTMTGLAILASLIFFWSPYSQSLRGNEVSVPRPFFDAVAGPITKTLFQTQMPSGADRSVYDQAVSDAKDQAYNFINQQLNFQGRAYKKFLPAGLAVSFFFAVRVWGSILMGLAISLAWLVYRMFVFFGVVKLINKEEIKEEIEYNF